MAVKPAGIDIERNYVTVSLCVRKNLYEAVCETSLAPSCMDRPTFDSIYLFIYLFTFLNCNQQFANFKRNQFPSAVR